jgi:hypothetical protein
MTGEMQQWYPFSVEEKKTIELTELVYLYTHPFNQLCVIYCLMKYYRKGNWEIKNNAILCARTHE